MTTSTELKKQGCDDQKDQVENTNEAEEANKHMPKEVLALTEAFWEVWIRLTGYPLFPLVRLIQESATAAECTMLKDYLLETHIRTNDLLNASISDQVLRGQGTVTA